MARLATLALLCASCSVPQAALTSDATDPAQGWERLRSALFVRRGPDGREYGADEADPLLFPTSSYLLREPCLGESSRALDALLADTHACANLKPLERVLWQRELWSVFDWLVDHDPVAHGAPPRPESEVLQALEQRLAPLLRRLALDARELSALPAPPDGASGTPAGLFSAEQGWVRLGDELGRPMAPTHRFFLGGRSHFEVLLRLPEGREATLAYLARLRGMNEPFVVESDGLHFRRDLPQFPAGTAVALVRRAVLFDTRGELVVTPLVESVQLRTYLAIAGPADPNPYSDDLSKLQDLAEFQLRPRLWLAGQDGGLARLRRGEADFSAFGTHGTDPFEEPGGLDPWIQTALRRCGGCHAQPGIYAVNSFTRAAAGAGSLFFGNPRERPTVPIEGDARAQSEATLAFARERASWKALQEAWLAAPR